MMVKQTPGGRGVQWDSSQVLKLVPGSQSFPNPLDPTKQSVMALGNGIPTTVHVKFGAAGVVAGMSDVAMGQGIKEFVVPVGTAAVAIHAEKAQEIICQWGYSTGVPYIELLPQLPGNDLQDGDRIAISRAGVEYQSTLVDLKPKAAAGKVAAEPTTTAKPVRDLHKPDLPEQDQRGAIRDPSPTKPAKTPEPAHKADHRKK